jgi:hypothetical protein
MKSLKEVQKASKQLKKGLGLRGVLAPGDLQERKSELESRRKVVNMPKMSKIKDVSFRGLI